MPDDQQQQDIINALDDDMIVDGPQLCFLPATPVAPMELMIPFNRIYLPSVKVYHLIYLFFQSALISVFLWVLN